MVIAGAEGDCDEAFGVVKLDPGGKPDLDGFAAQMMRATGSPAASPRHTTDGVLMLGAYGWAFVKPIRKLYYNLTITVVSVVVAIVVGGLEVLNLIGDQLRLTDGGGFWDAIGTLNDTFGVLGYVIVGIFIAAW
jgi:HoxN/HupN/NixA family high-affinity nickel-transporter